MNKQIINGKAVSRWFTRGKARIPIFEDGSIGLESFVTQGREDKEKLKGETREQHQKWANAYYQGHNREYYKNIVDKWAEKGSNAKDTKEYTFARGQRDAWREQYNAVVKQENDFNKLYDNPEEYKGDTSDLKGKHIYKYSTETQEQLDKASSLRDLNTGRIYDKTAIDQYKSRKDGYYYYIDTNVKNRDNPQFETYKERKYNNLNEVDVSKRVKENKIVDSFGNNVVYQNDKGNWVTSRKNYNDYATGKAERLGGTLVLNEKDARETLASYDALEKYPYKGYVADMKSGNGAKYKEQKQANLDKMYKTIGYDDSKYNYGFKKEDYNTEIIEKFKERKGKTLETYSKTGNIRYNAFGIERTPEGDFSDDGTRFTAYRLPNGMEMTVAKNSDDIYMSVRNPYHKEIKYEEYSNLPHYKDLDMYNGVKKDSVDLNKLVNSSNEYMNEYNQLLKTKGIKPEVRTIKQIRLDNIKEQIESNNKSIEYYENSKDYSRWRYNRQQIDRLNKKNEKLRKELTKI